MHITDGVTLEQALDEIRAAATADQLEAARVRFLGRKAGLLNQAYKQIKALTTDARKDRGRQLQLARAEITAALDKCNQALGADTAAGKPSVGRDRDRSVPGVFPAVGHVHPLTQTIEEIVRIFSSLGFDLAEGPEVETEWYNFDALNITPDHPAREEYQSFYLGHGRAMRSQTSSVQIRVMEQRLKERGAVPVRIIAPGRVFRPDSIDATHHSTFHQVEGLWVDQGVTMADLKGVLDLFMKGLLGAETKIRFRPSFFPFTEPSAELDVHWSVSGKPEDAEWLEMAGCGMVDPNVLETVGYDPETYTGFAFGFGIDRLTMLRCRINDVRLFLENDLRFLEQF